MSPTATITFTGPPPFETPTPTPAGTSSPAPTTTMTILPRTGDGSLWSPAVVTLGLALLAGIAASRRAV